VLQHYAWRYFIIAAGMWVQHEITMVLSIYLVLHHYLGWFGFIVSILAGSFAYEASIYTFGRFAKGTAIGRFIERKIPRYEKLGFHLHKNSDVFLVLSRFVAYMSSGTVFLSGFTKMPVKRFARGRAIANILWFIIIGGASYLLLTGYGFIDPKLIHRFELVVLVLIVGIIIGSKHLAKKVIVKTIEVEERAEKLGEKIEKKLTESGP